MDDLITVMYEYLGKEVDLIRIFLVGQQRNGHHKCGQFKIIMLYKNVIVAFAFLANQ